MNSWYNSLQGIGVFLRGFLISTIIFILSWCALIVFIDPIHYFRLNNKISLYPHTRWQNAGIIKHIPFDSIVIGTSMTQNFDLKQISSLLNCHCVSLALPGCDVQEQLVVLKKAIESKKLKTIIWAIDRWCLGYKKDSFRASFPVELYQNQYKGVARYLFSFEMFKSAAYKLFKYYILGKAPLNVYEELQKENMWFRYERLNFSKSAVMKEYKQRMGSSANYTQNDFLTKFNSLTAKIDNFSKKDNLTYKNFENDVLRIIEQNPTIKFIIYLPPYSLAHQKINFINQDYFLEDMNFRGYMIKQLMQHKNVEIYDFETIEWIVSDLNNYKDIIHFSREINDFMVKSFHTGAHRIKTFEDLLNSQRSFAKLPVLDFK